MSTLKLKPCKTCGKDVAASPFTKSCPHCGQKDPSITLAEQAQGFFVLVLVILVVVVIFRISGGDSDTSPDTSPKATVKSANLPRRAEHDKPIPQNTKTESELDKCATLARAKGVELSGSLTASDLGEGLNRYAANATYRGNACRPFVCLVWGGEMDSAACLRGATQDELFCANPPCFR